MSLSAYQKKRRFSQTPEPKGKVQDTNGPLTFVVQRHQASQLHYDFRLELNGVLKSWAVPRGPSLDPDDKRLAMMVEDHPMDYANFEGIIPKGNYGAGTVMVWDSGVYSPYGAVEGKEAEKILSDQLEKGHLTFIMLGQKLKGEFALVKIKNSDDENAWLLLKKGDEYQSKKDILKEDKSVLTGRSMDEIKNQAQKKKEVWYSKPKDLDLGNAKKSEMPHEVKPMLAKEVEEPFSRKNWIFELKWDGYRTLAEIEFGNVRLYSRNHQPFNDKFVEVAESLKKFPGNAVLDGEAVVLDEKGHPNFQLLQDFPKSKGELVYYVFDILYFDGHNLEDLPLIKRKEILKQVLPPLPNIRFSDHIEDDGVEFFSQAQKLGLEGIIAKNGDSKYQEGFRSDQWLKIKTHKTQDAFIAGYTEPKGGRKHLGALVLGLYKGKQLQYIGHAGGGFNDKSLEAILKKLEPLKQDECPFEETPKTNAPVTWVKPELSCEVTFSSWTNDGIMRHPVFVKLIENETVEPNNDRHSGKRRLYQNHEQEGSWTSQDDSTEVKDDNNQKETFFSPEAPGKEEIQEVQIGKRTLKLSNLNKVFWPEEKYTKGDLISYYKEVAPFILPYLKNRPQSLLRFPNGITGESFFQKDARNLKTEWVMRGKVHSRHKEESIEYLLCQDTESLIYIINLGCIDLNPWNSTIQNLDKPDYLIIDLDPEDIAFEKVVEVALASREILESLGIESFPKTSGSRGMHIFIPMGAKYDYEQVRFFAELLCHQIHKKLPEITSLVRNPKDRQKKVYLDFLQNIRGQTLASVYSVRAKPGATVSTPLKWSEVNSKLHPSQFTMKNIFKRLENEGDLFKGILEKGTNIEKVLKKLDPMKNSLED